MSQHACCCLRSLNRIQARLGLRRCRLTLCLQSRWRRWREDFAGVEAALGLHRQAEEEA